MKTNYDLFKLLDRCIRKEREAWDSFIAAFGDTMCRYIDEILNMYAYPFPNDAAEDIMNSVFLELLNENCKRLKDFQGKDETSFLAYLKMICFHITVNWLGEREPWIALEDVQDQDFYGNGTEDIEASDLEEIIMMLKCSLSARYYSLFILFYEEGFNLSEIAQMLHMKIRALHQLKSRMIKNIRKIAESKHLYPVLGISLTDPPCM